LIPDDGRPNDEYKQFGNTPNSIDRCYRCKQYLNKICSQMYSRDAKWFAQCIFEIDRFDGHIITERLPRLYSALSRTGEGS